MKTYISNSPRETQDIAFKIAKKFKNERSSSTNKGGVIALTGQLGAGKTTFVQGFAKGLGIKEKIISPTFVLIKQHKIPNSNNYLFHIDLYRLEEKVYPKKLGLEDMLSNKGNIVIVEWAEKLKTDSLKGDLNILIKKAKDNQRLLILS